MAVISGLGIYWLPKFGTYAEGTMHQINSRLGQRIRLLRRAKGLTQEGLADTSGLNRSHLGEIERGEVDVTIATLARIGMALETSMPALLRGVVREQA